MDAGIHLWFRRNQKLSNQQGLSHPPHAQQFFFSFLETSEAEDGSDLTPHGVSRAVKIHGQEVKNDHQ